MKLPDLSKYFRSIRQIKIEDLRFSSLTDLISSNNISFGTFKDTFLAFVSIKRNRLIISSGIASIFLLSLLPQKIELLITRKSLLFEYTSEALYSMIFKTRLSVLNLPGETRYLQNSHP